MKLYILLRRIDWLNLPHVRACTVWPKKSSWVSLACWVTAALRTLSKWPWSPMKRRSWRRAPRPCGACRRSSPSEKLPSEEHASELKSSLLPLPTPSKPGSISAVTPHSAPCLQPLLHPSIPQCYLHPYPPTLQIVPQLPPFLKFRHLKATPQTCRP